MQYGSNTYLSHQTVLILLSIEGSERIFVLEYVKPQITNLQKVRDGYVLYYVPDAELFVLTYHVPHRVCTSAS